MADVTYHQRRIDWVYEEAKRLFNNPELYKVGELVHREVGFLGFGRDRLATFNIQYVGGQDIALNVSYSEKRTALKKNAFEVCVSHGRGLLGSNHKVSNLTGSKTIHMMQDLEQKLYKKVWMKKDENLKMCASPAP